MLFDPRADSGGRYCRDEDHLAMICELLGRLPRRLAQEGSRAKQLLNRCAAGAAPRATAAAALGGSGL